MQNYIYSYTLVTGKREQDTDAIVVRKQTPEMLCSATPGKTWNDLLQSLSPPCINTAILKN